MEFWIARDRNGILCLFNGKPILEGDRFIGGIDEDGHFINHLVINRKLFPEVVFENSPQKVKLELMDFI